MGETFLSVFFFLELLLNRYKTLHVHIILIKIKLLFFK